MSVPSTVLVTEDDDVRAAVGRLASLAGAPVEVVWPVTAVASRWGAAGLIVLDAALVTAVAALRLPRRPRLVIVTIGSSPQPALFRSALDLGAEQVVALPGGQRDLLDLLTPAPVGGQAPGAVIGVVGGCGGAGASTLAAALAVTAAAAGEVALVDLDAAGGGLDVLLGAEQLPGARWSTLAGVGEPVDAGRLAAALVRCHGLTLLSFDRMGPPELPAEAAGGVIDSLRRSGSVVLDLPRADSRCSGPALARCDLVAVVVPATVRAVAAAAPVVRRLAGPRLRVVVRDAGVHGVSAEQVGRELSVPVVAAYRSESAVADAVARGGSPLGRGRGSLATACSRLLGCIGDGRRAA